MRFDRVTLNDGRSMPRIGLGVWEVPADETATMVARAIETGFRLIDTASIYGNEQGVGEGLRRAGLAPGDVFVTTKVWNDSHGRDATLRAFDASLRRLGLDRVDLYLIHWPVPRNDRFVETWRALILLRDEGRARSIGVSNFSPAQIERLFEETGVLPSVNQIEVHPLFQQREARAFHAERGIATECWTPLGRAGSFDHPVIRDLAGKHGRSPAQIVLRWHLDSGCVVIPRTTRPERLAENLAALDFRLDPEDLDTIAPLDAGRRLGPDPATFD